MSKLQFKTIAGEHPQGKPNVYFTCHPEDFERYFEEYTTKILHIQDCAIWYEAEPKAEYDRDDLELNLSQMQLFIMPVTTKLLTTPNRAMDIEFPIAQEKHIPVLPLMMENNLDDVFSKKFGNLQYLDPNNRDETRRSFDEVLETYIRSVLVSDDLAKKVRAAFDAYIFLSYRKKDRMKAQKLMRLIHRNPLCRDIAIWYDEFLTPGEDFNQAIKAMLEKSDLFTLVVTPNLINEVNYVMTTEYPAAVKQAKPVLPVEMEETDRVQLEDHYKFLPPCVCGEENDQFREALLGKIREMAISANDEDPEHNFLIGLAYLDGIDVEVDSERAMGLIKGAAEAGILEAISHLIMMYETGKGTERDYQKGIEWRVKQVALIKEKYEAEPNEDNAWNLVSKLWSLGDAQYNRRMLNDAEAVYHEMCILANQYSGTISFLSALSISYERLGIIAESKENLAEAQSYYEKSLTIGKEHRWGTKMVELRQNLSLSYQKLGDIANKRGNIARAKEYYDRSIAINEEVVKETGTVKSRLNLSYSYILLGNIFKSQGRLRIAQKYYEKCRIINEELENALKTSKSRGQLDLAYEKLGTIAQAQGDVTGATTYYERCLTIRTEQAMETGTIESCRNLVVIYDKLGYIAQVQGDLVKAQSYYKKSFDLSTELAIKTGTVEAQQDLILCYERLGYIAEVQGDLSRAQSFYKKSLDISEALIRETSAMDSRLNVSAIYDDLGRIAQAQGNLTGAQKYFEKFLAISKELASETRLVDWRRNLFICYISLGNIAQEQENLEGAQAYFEKGLAISEELAIETETMWSRRNLFVSYDYLGLITELREDLEGAQAYYEKGLAISKDLASKTGMVESRRDLSVSYAHLGNITKAQGKIEEAQTYYEKSLAISEELVSTTGTVELRQDLAITYSNLGDIAQACGDLSKDQVYYEKSLTVREALVRATGTVESRRNLLISYSNLGDIAQACGDLSKAQAYYEKSLVISEALVRATGTVGSRRDLSICYDNLGDNAQACGDLSKAQAYYEKSLAISEALARAIGTVVSRRDLSICYSKLGDIAKARGQVTEAQIYLKKSLAIREELDNDTGILEPHGEEIVEIEDHVSSFIPSNEDVKKDEIIEQYKAFIKSQKDGSNYIIYDIDKDGYPEVMIEKLILEWRTSLYSLYKYKDGSFIFIDVINSPYPHSPAEYASYPYDNGMVESFMFRNAERVAIVTISDGKIEKDYRYSEFGISSAAYYRDRYDQQYKDSKNHQSYINHQYYQSDSSYPYYEGSVLLAQSAMNDFTAVYEAFGK